MDTDVRRYLDQLVAAARAVLGEDLTGAYAAGSVALDAYQPGRSDVDVALVSARPLAGAEKSALVAALRHETLPCPARGLELVAYTAAAARSGTPEPGFELELNTGAGMPFRQTLSVTGRPAEDGLFWYALDRSILHQHGRTLIGPPAADTFADLAPDDLRRLLLDALTWWLARPFPPGDTPAPGAEDAVLGACRSLVRVRDGVWLSKVDAGRRLAELGYAPELIGRAIAARTGGSPPGGAEASAFQRQVLAEIDTPVAGSGRGC